MNKRLLQYLLPLMLLLALSGCREPNAFEVALYTDETVARGDKVYLQGEPVAVVEDIYLVAEDQPVARVRLTGKAFEDRFVNGIQRKPGRGEIQLELAPAPDGITPQPLMTGSRIPLRNSPLPPSLWPPNQNTLILGVAFLVALIAVFFIFKLMMRIVLTALALALAVGTAWLAYPYAVPYAQQAIDLARQEAEVQITANGSSPDQDGAVIEETLQKVSHFVRREQINPVVVAFAALTLIAFVIYSVILGYARRRLTGPTE